MSKIQCLKCGADLPALDGSPCPKCGTIADKGRVTDEFQTLRKVTAKAEYIAQTKRRVGALLKFYRENPKILCWHIFLVIIINFATVFLGCHIANSWTTLLPSIVASALASFLSILVVLFVRPPKEKGVMWPE